LEKIILNRSWTLTVKKTLNCRDFLNKIIIVNYIWFNSYLDNVIIKFPFIIGVIHYDIASKLNMPLVAALI